MIIDCRVFVLQVFPEILHEVQSELSQKRRKPSRHATLSSTYVHRIVNVTICAFLAATNTIFGRKLRETNDL